MYVILVEAGKWKNADIIGPFNNHGEALAVLADVNAHGYGYLKELCSFEDHMLYEGCWSWQFCSADNEDITGSLYAEEDAIEKRLWCENGDLIEVWTRSTTADEWVKGNTHG